MVQNTAKWVPAVEQIKVAITLGLRGEWSAVMGEVRRRIYSEDTSYILRRDLEVPIEIPAAKILQVLVKGRRLEFPEGFCP